MKEKIIKNYLYSLTYQLLTIIVPLVTTPYIARVLSSKEMGLYDYSLTICTYFMFVASAGIPILAQREIVTCGDELEKCFSFYYKLRLWLSIVVFCVYCLVVLLFFNNKIIYFIQGIGIIASGFDISWYYAGRENFKTIMNRNIVFKIFSIVLLFAFVKGKYSLIFYVLTITVPNLIGNFLFFWKLDVKIIPVSVDLNSISATLKASIMLLIPSLVLQLYSIIDKTILGSLSTLSELGYYAQVFKIINLFVLCASTLGNVVFPQMVRKYNENKQEMCMLVSKSLDVVIHLFFFLLFGFSACVDVFSDWFYGKNYTGIDNLLIMAIPIAVFKALSYIIANQALLASNREKDLIIVMFQGTFINCLFDLMFVKSFGAKGAIIATVISEIFILIKSLRLFKKKIGNIVLLNTDNIRATIAALFECIVILGLKKYIVIENPIIYTLILGLIGTGVYIILLKVFNDSYYLIVRKLIYNRVFCKGKR